MGSRPGTAPAVADRGGDFVRKNLVSSSTPASHKAAVTALAWSASGKRLATASLDGAIKVWLVSPDTVHTEKSIKPEWEYTHTNSGKQECITSLVFNPRRDEQLLIVGAHLCRVLNLGAKGSTSTHCEADVHDAIGATWDTHDNILVAQLYNKFSHIDMRRPLDKGKKRPVEKLSIGGGDEVTDVRFIDRGRRVLVSTQHGVEVRSWPEFSNKLTVLDGHAKHGGRDGGVLAMAVTREEDNKPLKPVTRLLATGGMDTLICIWDLQQAVPATIIYRPDEPVRALSFSADTALLAYCQEDVPGQPSSVEVMDTKAGHHVTSVPLQRGTEFVAFNPRYNKLLALAEPVLIQNSSSGYRSAKDKDTSLSAYVSLVQLK